jgi:acyl transferase domain-containing protein/thioester reductase-like protein/acyl carrier protein
LHDWVLQTFSELPQHWATIAKEYPSLNTLPAEQQLEDIIDCLRTGNTPKATFPLPNLVLVPLVIVVQLTQYFRYRDLVTTTDDKEWLADTNSESVGFCVGVLSSLAVSCSTTRKQLEQHGSAAVRLAMLIGALMDVESSNKYVSISASWQREGGKEALDKALQKFPDVRIDPTFYLHNMIDPNTPQTYVSVAYDKNRFTVTCPESDCSALSQMLQDSEVNVKDIALRGRYHHPEHSADIEALVAFCNSREEFTIGNASHLVLPARIDGSGCIESGSLQELALRAILVDQCEWYETFTSLQAQLVENESSFVSFGLENCIPPSYRRTIGQRVLNMADVDSGKARLTPVAQDERIAVIGMSGRVPGANDLEEFWKLLCENQSQHSEVPTDRFSFETEWRDVDPKRKWFGNFIEDFDVFDNKFFNKSPREAAAMDPQQKMMLQIAYQTVQQSGYYSSSKVDKHIGCYVGVSNVDYQDNAAGYSATAYTATGTLMSFVAGKVSHHFGWTGPSMSIDTACSGSAVAVHEACKAILSGDCTSALAGGVNAITNALWFQNLAGASFLSQTGQCKPFDAKGDGYCRGEAVGAVFLKRLSAAIADGDTIFGTIAATAVHQNRNNTAITVPNTPSLAHLFDEVTTRANIDPMDITVVEAHGTGTAVGDPAEYGAIRQALGGPERSSKIALGSVKGLVGHAECASGMVALLKTMLMINESTIAPQASHDTINPALHASPSDNIEIPLNLKPWNTKFKAALINNYGASGSNASMVITEAPGGRSGLLNSSADSKVAQPFWFSGTDDEGLGAYISKFLSFLRSKTISSKNITLSNLAFNVGRQSNRSLDRALMFTADSIEKLQSELERFGRSELAAVDMPKSKRPVILCFGGQTSTFVGLDKEVVERTVVFKKYLDQCDLVCKSMGLRGIYPDIFQRSPIEDTVQFQTSFFALQYSCAKSWIESGVEVTAMVGHSFGEIVAQTVAGAMSLADGLKVIARRAALIRDSWNSDRGMMMAIQADLEVIEKLIARANEEGPSECPAGIACFNGPRSFTVAGSTQAMKALESILAKKEKSFSSVQGRMLGTSHAFHSTLVEALIPDLKQITEDITFNEPKIRVERAMKSQFSGQLPSTYVAEHLRQPVCFNHAVQRLAEEFDNAIWLEAGSQSTVTKMAAKALGNPKTANFQDANLTNDGSWLKLAEATIALWKQGLNVTFWPHHSSQVSHYAPIILPPFQFKKSRHYLDMKRHQRVAATSSEATQDTPPGLWTFIEYKDPAKKSVRFHVETSHKDFQELMAGHTVAHSQPLCPSTLQLDITTEALRSICPEFPISDYQIDLRRLENQAPLCRDPTRDVWLDAECTDETRNSWSWKITSNPINSKTGMTAHASGKLIFLSREDSEYLNEFSRLQRLVTHKRCKEILEGNDEDDILQGNAIYKLFSDVVDYSEIFRGVRKVVGRGVESAGRVVKKYHPETLFDTTLMDSFCQVAGAFVNCMTQRPEGDAFISTGVDRVIKSPTVRDFESSPEVFDVLALHHHSEDRSHWSSDVFVFDTNTSELLGVLLGIQYARVSKQAMARLLAHLTPGAKQPSVAPKKSAPATQTPAPAQKEEKPSKEEKQAKSAPQPSSSSSEISEKLIAILSEMVGVEPEKIKTDTSLPDLGIDSLMGMEVGRELEQAFETTLDSTAMMELTKFGDLVKFLQTALGEEDTTVEEETTYNEEAESSKESDATPPSLSSSTDGSVVEDTPPSSNPSSGATSPKLPSDAPHRQVAIDGFVQKYAKDFTFKPATDEISTTKTTDGYCVLVTGGTGSLGGQLVRTLAEQPSVTSVVCFNRPSRGDPRTRQRSALEERGIFLDRDAFAKLHVIASDTSKPFLGLDKKAYVDLASKVTHIIHCAWPMSIARPIDGFENQFTAMRNLINLSRDASSKFSAGEKTGFQFVSSIATVGLYPNVTGQNTAPEKPSAAEYALSSGYSDAKLVCEKLLDQTLNQHPDRAIAMSVRVGQVSGSRENAYWNPAEHFPMLIKSAKALNTLPDLPGHLSWLPVEDVAASLVELVLSDKPASSTYHVENPVRQPWSEVLNLIAVELGIPRENKVSYEEWLQRVRDFPRERDSENPARKVMEFLENHFLRMATGGLVLGTEEAVKVSKTLGTATPVEEGLIRKYVQTWKEIGFIGQK